MAEAEAEGITAAVSEAELAMPIMPHTVLAPDELDRLYPSLVPAEEVDDPDAADGTEDLMYQHGVKVAADIERAMVSLGRTRREGQTRQATTDVVRQ